MRVVGYCLKCRRIRQVRVTRWGQPAVGICADCEREERR